jgi:hypothetical protein
MFHLLKRASASQSAIHKSFVGSFKNIYRQWLALSANQEDYWGKKKRFSLRMPSVTTDNDDDDDVIRDSLAVVLENGGKRQWTSHKHMLLVGRRSVVWEKNWRCFFEKKNWPINSPNKHFSFVIKF